MGDQLESLVRFPGVGAGLFDKCQALDSCLVKATVHEHRQDIEVGLARAVIDRVIGRMHLEGIEFAVIDAAKRIRHRQSTINKIGSQSRPAIPVVDPAGLVPEPVFRNNIGCFDWCGGPGALTFATRRVPEWFGPIAAHFRSNAFPEGINVTSGAVDMSNMPVGGNAIRCGRSMSAGSRHRSMTIHAFRHHRADVLAPHIIAAAGDLMVQSGMAGGAGQLCSAC